MLVARLGVLKIIRLLKKKKSWTKTQKPKKENKTKINKYPRPPQKNPQTQNKTTLDLQMAPRTSTSFPGRL